MEYTYSDIYSLAYPAVDAMVGEMLDRFVQDNPPVPLKATWTQRSAGSSLHRVADLADNEMFHVVVRMQPETEQVVTVNFVTTNPNTAAVLPGLLDRVRQTVARHRATFARLKQAGVKVLAATTTIPDCPPPPRPGDTDAQFAVLQWYETYDPHAPHKEIAEYCRVAPQTIRNWRHAHGFGEQSKKEV